MPITNAEVGSQNVSAMTLQLRSAAIERAICLSSALHISTADIEAQQTSLLRRNTNQFLEAAKQAGMKIFGKMQLIPQALAAMKAELPTAMMYMLKRLLNDELGVDIFGPLDKLGQSLKPFMVQLMFLTAVV